MKSQKNNQNTSKKPYIHFLALAAIMLVFAQLVYGQNDSLLIQRRIEARIALDEKIRQNINSSGSNKNQLLQQYETIRNIHYQRLADMGVLSAAELINSSVRSSAQTPSTPRVSYAYYVSTTGSDSNAGTQNAPFQTIQKAIDSSIGWSGGFIKIEDGTYTTDNLNIQGKSIRLYGNDNNPDAVVINGTGNGSVVSVNGGYFYLIGIKITGGNSGNQAVISVKNGGLNFLNAIVADNHSNKAIIGPETTNDYYYGIFFNTLIYNNHVDGSSDDGIIVMNGSEIEFYNNTMTDNKAPAAIVPKNSCYANIYSSILYNYQSNVEIKNATNNASIILQQCNVRNYTTISGNVYIYGMIDTDPKFVSPKHNLYQLADDSPCIDTGHNWGSDAHFPPAKGTSLCDMGAYGGPYVSEQPYQKLVADLPAVTVSPSANQNYIHTIIPQIETSSIPSGARSPSHYSETIEYLDGLGRPLQSVVVGASPDGMDIVIPIEYDIAGRQAKKYLPYKANTNNGTYKTNSFSDQQLFHGSLEKPWGDVDFEQSPLNRVLKEIGTGSGWHGSGNWKDNGKYTAYAYATNVANEVRLWIVADTLVSSTGNYAAGTLYVTEITDEDGRKVTEYIDLQGQTIRKQQYLSGSGSGAVYAITDYVYDDFGRLRYVLPPAIIKTANKTITISSTEFVQYVFAYKYDERDRVVEKHIPGAGWTYIIYNKIDRPILSQDAEQRARDEWNYTKYDAFGRVAFTGLYHHSSQITREALQSLAYGSGYTQWEIRSGYWMDSAFPPAGANFPFSFNYYDNYDFHGNEPHTGVGVNFRTKGLQTGSTVRILEGSLSQESTTNFFYDKYGNVIHFKTHQLSVENATVKDETTNVYDFTGQLLSATRKHIKGGVTMFSLTTTNEYDHAGRLKTTTQNIGDGNVTVAENTYDALGRLTKTELHEGFETINYTYNIRGWLTSINSENFKEKLRYNEVVSSINNTPQWAGNISAAEWKAIAKDEYWHAYKYT